MILLLNESGKSLIMDEVVLKAINNKELSAQEKDQLEEWLKESKQNRMIYNQLKLAVKYPNTEKIDSLKASGLAKLKNKMAKSQKTITVSSGIPLILKIAAVFLLTLTISIIIYRFQQTQSDDLAIELRNIEKVSLPGQKLTINLPDGTIVKLNAESKLSFPRHFEKDQRVVQLTGEAFFDVNRDTQRPFIVNSGNLKIEVLGTSFNVRSYQKNRESVAVKTGKVRVESSGTKTTLLLSPNEMAAFDGLHLSRNHIHNRDLSFGWTEQRLVFDETPLPEVFETISRWYGKEIIIRKDLEKDRPYTANYDNPTVEQVFKSLSHLYQFDYENNEKQIVIQ